MTFFNQQDFFISQVMKYFTTNTNYWVLQIIKYNRLVKKRYEGIQSLDILSIQLAKSLLFECSSCKKLSFFRSIPNSFPIFVGFFHPLGKKNLPNSNFSSLQGIFFLNLNFKNLKVVLEAAESVEATIQNTQTLKELSIEQKKVPSNIGNEKKNPLDFCSISDRSVSSDGTLLPWPGFLLQPSLRSKQ